MATESILNKVNVFPNLSSFNDNSDDVDSNSLNLIKTGAVLVESWRSGQNWYKKWSNGFIEQGGFDGTSFAGSTGRTVTFNVEMTTVCNVVPVLYGAYTSNSTGVTNITAVTSTTFTVKGSNGVTNKGVYWEACGY